MWIPFLYWARLFLPRIASFAWVQSECCSHFAMAMVFGHESFERFLQSSWEMYVDNCRQPVKYFSRIYMFIYSWWKYRYPWWLLAISQCGWVEYSDVPVIVCTMTWVGGGFPSTGCILPIRCLSMWNWLAFTDSMALISLFARSWILMYWCHTSPPVALNEE